MVVELKLSKTGESRFGFRLVGGADFDTPLTVSLVTEESIAEQAGMLEGDVVVRINDIPTIPLTHQEAHEVLSRGGNNIVLGVLRERDLTPSGPSPAPTTASDPLDFAEDYKLEPLSFPQDPTIITDDQIAELLSGEAEVLKDHNIMGVNFNKMMPQVGVFKHSEVFQTLNQEARKSKQEIEEEEKRWTTFLQKPDRPVPSAADKFMCPKQTYKPKIVKQNKPRITAELLEQDALRSPSPLQSYPIQIPLARSTATPEPRNLEPEEMRPETPIPEIKIETPVPEELEPETEPTPIIEEARKEETESKEEQDEFVKQLAHVQHQLEALSSLPTTIQATLDAITHQLTQLINPPKVEVKQEKKVVEELPKEEEPEPEPEPEIEPTILKVQEESFDIPEDPGAVHLGPHSVKEYEEIQKEVDDHEEDWENKFEKEWLPFWAANSTSDAGRSSRRLNVIIRSLGSLMLY